MWSEHSGDYRLDDPTQILFKHPYFLDKGTLAEHVGISEKWIDEVDCQGNNVHVVLVLDDSVLNSPETAVNGSGCQN